MAEPIDPSLFEENERFGQTSSPVQLAQLGSLRLRAGGHLDNVQVAYQTWGQLNAQGSNAVLVCHALSGDSNAAGWWDRVVGPGRALDPSQYFIIGANALGGCQGTTGPSSLAPDGKPFGSGFPAVTVEDMANCHAKLLDHLGIKSLFLACGGSMGGMQALELSLQHADRVQHVWLTASSLQHSAMQIGFNEAARQAILRDPKWKGGDYSLDDPPRQGLAVSRIVGHLSFLSVQAFESKFGRRLQHREQLEYSLDPEFQVESYLNYQGDKFTHRFDANSMLVLTKAIDWYEAVDLERAQAKYLVTSFDSDWLYTPQQGAAMAECLSKAGAEAQFHLISLPYGHDSFLLDGEHQTGFLSQFLADSAAKSAG